MTQSELNHAVSQALGEDVCEINQRGFSLVDPFDHEVDSESDHYPPQSIDWDAPFTGTTQPFFDI